MKSVFTFWPLLLFILLLISVGLVCLCLYIILIDGFNAPFGSFVFLIVFTFAFIWILFGEFKRKVVSLCISEEWLSFRRYYGLGMVRRYRLENITSIDISIVSSRFSSYEYMHLKEHGGREMIVSEFYHRNYFQLKNMLVEKIGVPSNKKYTLMEDLSGIFN